MQKTELLIPAGNMECLVAAIHNGADAIYIGGKKFGARAYSNNFTDEELIEAIKLCHLYGVKLYVTVNTMIYNEEIDEVINYLNFLYNLHIDAVIMQDIGLINLTRELIPDLNIHVSTQAHNHNEPGIDYYHQIGCTRVVFDRESSLESINNIKVNIEKEVFVYGALCVCYSGNCLFSALNGHRSANRGMCVGSCRLPYKLIKNNQEIDKGYLLSTKDLNTLPNLKEILSYHIDSLKVEGRMKSKEYVAVVTKTFRKLIDNYYQNKTLNLTKEEEINLLKTYNREFTKGYLFNATNIINKKTSNHQGIPIGHVIKVTKDRIYIKLTEDIAQEDAIRLKNTNTGMYLNTLYNERGLLVREVFKNNICQINNKDHLKEQDLLNSEVLKTIDYKLNQELNNYQLKKIPINISFKAHLNENIELIISDNTNSLKIEGKCPEKALNAPITKDTIIKQLSKLGNTPYILNNIDIDIDNNIFLNIKDLNEIRRKSTEELTNKRENNTINNHQITLKEFNKEISSNPQISILTRTEEQLLTCLNHHIDIIYTTDENLYNKYHNHPNLYLRLNRVLETFKDYHNERLLCTELGAINKYKDTNTIRSDYYLNIINDYSIETLSNLNTKSITLSVEANLNTLKNISNKNSSEIIIYGTLENMIIKNNIFNINNEKTYLKDYQNNKYPITYDGYTHIFNHEKINYLNNLNELKGFGTYRIELFDESKEELETLINKLKDML